MPLHCPHCQSTIVIEGKPPREVVCPSCGSSIPIDIRATSAWLPDEAPKRLGRFEFLEQLGVGSFGAVYKARDTELDRIVAVKIPRAANVPRPEDLDRFLREARSAAQLKHPSIVALYDAGQSDGTCYLVSEFVQGATLAERLSANRLSFRQAAELIAEVADALHYAHQHGVVHRDIKPSNIMLDLEGRPHLMDFGLAKRAADEITMTLEGQVLGTPAYMSPEQARGEGRRVDARSDLYSLGVILYELLTGELPFRGQTRMLLVQVIQDEPRPPRRLNDRIPRDLETICLKAMAKEPARRYQSARDLADDLRRYLKGEPILARPLGRIVRAWRWCRRNPVVASLTAAVAVLLIAGASVATYFAIDATLARDRADAKAKEAEENARQTLLEKEQTLLEKERADRKALEAETNAAEAHANLYVVRINTIQLAWENGNLALARELLERVRRRRPEQKDLRGWEWHYFRRLCHQQVDTIDPDDGSVDNLAFSPDGQRLVTAGDQVKVWDTATRKELLALKKHGSIDGVAYSPDGTRIATAGDRVRVWDATTGQELILLEKPGPSKCVVFSPDGKRLASGFRRIRVWDAASGQELHALVGHSDEVRGLAYSPDGKQLASASKDKTVRLWDTASAREISKLEGHLGAANAVAFRPDGLQLASCGDEADLSIKLWDSRTGQLLRTLTGHTRRVYAVAFSPDGLLLASGSSDDTTKIWDPSQGLELHTLKGHASGTHSLAFTPDGRRLASGSSDATVRLWDVVRGPETRIFKEHANQVRAVRFSSAGQRLVSVGLDGKINVWDAVTGQEQRLFPKSPTGDLGMAISPDGRHLATAGDAGAVQVWDLTTGKNLWKGKGHPSWVSALAFSADGQWLASGGAPDRDDRKQPVLIKLWETSTGKEVRSFRGHSAEIKGLAFTPDGSQLISGSQDSTLKVWDVAKGAELKTIRGHKLGITSIALHRDGNLLASASSDRTVKLWDLAKGQEVRTLLGHFDIAWSVAFHPDGTRLATAGFDQTVRVWDVATGLELASLKGHSDRVLGVAFSPDGNYLASAGGIDLTVRLWDARPPTPDINVEAVAVLDFLFAKPLPKSEVRAAIQRDQSISTATRQKALELAERYKEETDPNKYHAPAWPVIQHPYANVFMCQFALAQTKAACDFAADNLQYRLALGVAQYRLGKFQKERYKEALVTLTKCDQTQPTTLAFLAMTQHQLGEKEQARTTLARLRETMKEPPLASNAEAVAFLGEAEAVMGAKAGVPVR